VSGHRKDIRISGTFFIARLVLILSLSLEGIQSYGDYWNFFHLAGLGRPFLDIWVEFPPLFPFLSRGIYSLVGGRENAYIYLGALFFSLIQAGSIYLFQRIAGEIWGSEGGGQRALVYALFIVGLFYGWAYFDCLAVFLTLLGLYFVVKSKHISAGVVLGLGGLVKWFPLLILPAAWKRMDGKKAAYVVLSSLLVIITVWGVLYIVSPSMTAASLVSQGAKGSWESIWAILDGNLQTGNFSPAANRFDPATASLPAGNPSVVPSWLTLLFFAGVGIFLFWRAKIQTGLQLIAFSGLTMVLFFLWSPGYSPQWVLFLLPLVLLSFENNRSLLIGLVILLMNLLEWPLLLSRGLFQYLPALIILRSIIYGMIGLLFIKVVFKNDQPIRESSQ